MVAQVESEQPRTALTAGRIASGARTPHSLTRRLRGEMQDGIPRAFFTALKGATQFTHESARGAYVSRQMPQTEAIAVPSSFTGSW
jgi:hypothetical protein